jgi:hypothetical protein
MGYCGAYGVAGGGPKIWDFPLYIPAGARIAAQVAGARLGNAMRVQVWLRGGNGYPPYRVGTKVTTYGMGTVPSGVSITPGTTGAEGAWTQITASTSEDHFAFVPSFQASADVSISNSVYAVDIGIGAATEEEILQTALFTSDTTESMMGPIPSFPAFQDVPASTRLTMRVSNSNATNDGAYNAVIHAVS